MLSNSVDEDINVQPFDEDVKQQPAKKSMSHRDIEKQSETSTEVVEEA